MKSYLVLTPPGGPDPDHRNTIILADRFSWLALLFPWIWLLTRKLWLAAAIVFVLQLAAGWLMQVPGFETAGLVLTLAVNLLVALEGRHFHSEMLIRRGWVLQDVVTAPDLDTAEEVYFSGLPQTKAELPAVESWVPTAGLHSSTGWRSQGGIGLFDTQGGR